MQQALPYRTTWFPTRPAEATRFVSRPQSAVDSVAAESSRKGLEDGLVESVKSLVSENAVIVFGRRGCCMCHVVKRLLLGLGVNPAVFEVDDQEDEALFINELVEKLNGNGGGGAGNLKRDGCEFPAVFIGGRLFGGLDRLMAAHISGDLIPVLKEAGALWL